MCESRERTRVKVQFGCRERDAHCQSTETHKDKKASTSGDKDDADNECESTERNNCNADGPHCNDDALKPGRTNLFSLLQVVNMALTASSLRDRATIVQNQVTM